MNKLEKVACLAMLVPAMTFAADDDPYLWLEEVEGEKALEWVEQQNDRSLGALKKLPEYEEFYRKNLAVYDSDERIPFPQIRGEHIYNFWRDAKNERGLWRRTTPADYTSKNPSWEVIIDLDELARK